MKKSFLFFMLFAAIFTMFGFLAADDADTTQPCELNVPIYETEAKHYLTCKTVGLINDSYGDTLASTSVVNLAGFGQKSLNSPSVMLFESFFEDYSDEVVAILIYADPVLSPNRYYQSTAVIAIPKSYLGYMKRENINTLPFAPQTYVVDTVSSVNGKYSKQCVIAMGRIKESEEFGNVTAGLMQVCHENNYDFSAGEKLKVAMNVELAVKEELLAMYEEGTTYDELCTCYDSNYYEIDCSDEDIKWEKSNYTIESEEDEEIADSSTEENEPDDNAEDDSEDDSANDDEPASDSDDIIQADEENTDDSDKETDKKEEKKSDGCSMIFV